MTKALFPDQPSRFIASGSLFLAVDSLLGSFYLGWARLPTARARLPVPRPSAHDAPRLSKLGRGSNTRRLRMTEPTTSARPARDVAAPRRPDLAAMAAIPAGSFTMGSDKHYPEEAPAHRVSVDAFHIDRHAVTNAEFRRFVEATGHVTNAERPADPAQAPRREAQTPRAVVGGLSQERRTRRPAKPLQLVDLRARHRLAPSARTRQFAPGPVATPGRARGLRRRRSLCGSGPARSCRPRPSGSTRRAADSTAPSSRGATS